MSKALGRVSKRPTTSPTLIAPVRRTAFGPFYLERLLGRGGMAEVFLAYRGDRPHKKVVLKRIRPEYADSKAFLQRFVLEAQIASRLNHPNLVRFLEFGRVGLCHYLVMDMVEGYSLHRLLEKTFEQKSQAPLEGSLMVGAAILEGVGTMHQLRDESGALRPMLHRDITPSNVILNKDGTPVLIDFGIAKDVKGPSITIPGQVVGTLRYMAPEHRRAEATDPSADVFSVSVLLFELIVGRHPWPPLRGIRELQRIEFDPPELTPKDRARVPDPVLKVLEKGLACDAKERWSDAEQMRNALFNALARPIDQAKARAEIETWLYGLDIPSDQELNRPVVNFTERTQGKLEVMWSATGSLAQEPSDEAPTLLRMQRSAVLDVPPLPPQKEEVDLDAATKAALGPRWPRAAIVSAVVVSLVGMIAWLSA